jgi:hypothetical protein
MYLDVLKRRLRRLQVRDNISPLRRLLSTGFLRKLAEKLVLTTQNKQTCHQRRKNDSVRMYHYMACLLPQRIFNMCLSRDNCATLINISANMGCCDAAIYLGLDYKKTFDRYESIFLKPNVVDYNKAVYYFEIAAFQGHPEAQYHLARMLIDFDFDQPKAKKWLTYAALKGHILSQFAMGTLCGPREEKIRWLNLAANQGHIDAQFMLGYHFEKSNKLEDAVSWYRLAASSDDWYANSNLLKLLKNHPELRQETEVQFFNDNAGCVSSTLEKRWFERK